MSQLITAKQLYHRLFYGVRTSVSPTDEQISATLKDLAAHVPSSDRDGIMRQLNACYWVTRYSGIVPAVGILRNLDKKRSGFRGVYCVYLEKRFP